MNKNKRKKRLSPQETQKLTDEFYVNFSRDLIADNMKPGDILPGEQELTRRYRIPLSIARHVYNEFKKEGIVESHKGKGVFLLRLPDKPVNGNQHNFLKLGIVAFLEKGNPEARFNRVSEVLRQFDQQSGINHCQTTLFNTYPSSSLDLDLLESIHDYQPDGLLNVPTQANEKEENIRQLRMLGIPIVAVGTKTDLVSSVTFDHHQVGYSAVEHLIRLEHRRIAFIQSEGNDFWQVDRFNGMKECLEKYQIPLYKKLIFKVSDPRHKHQWLSKEGPDIVKQLINEKCTAVFCSGDPIATSLIEHIKNAGLKVPEDFSIIGIGDYWKSRNYDLTTVQQADSELGYGGFELLTEIILKTPESPIHRKLSCPLLLRSTTGPVKVNALQN